MSLQSQHSVQTTYADQANGFDPDVGAVQNRTRINLPGNLLHVEQDEEIYGAGDHAASVFSIISGWVRTCNFLHDGRRQIDAFYGPGEIFGLEAGSKHTLSAEAVCNAKIVSYRRKSIEASGATAGFNSEIASYAIHRMHRAQSHALMLGRRSAVERVASFLLELAMAASGSDIVLPMARHDIADYLGLTTETISRTLTQLERDRVLALPTARHVLIRNRAKLQALASGEPVSNA